MEKLFRKVGKRYIEVEQKLSLNQELVLGAAVRYGLGRMTYIVSSICEELKRLEPQMSWNFKQRISNEIHEYQKEHEEVGMSFDNDEWEYIKCLFNKENRDIREANIYGTDDWIEVECFLHSNGEYYPLGENKNKGYLIKTRK
jgi:hypothetical protein